MNRRFLEYAVPPEQFVAQFLRVDAQDTVDQSRLSTRLYGTDCGVANLERHSMRCERKVQSCRNA